jgi:hypothetical protein
MKNKIGTSKSMKKYGPGGTIDSGPGSKSTSKDVDKLPPVSAPPTGTGYMKKGGSVGKSKKPKMAKGGSTPFKALAKPYDKATYADKIAGATMKKGGSVKSKKK